VFLVLVDQALRWDEREAIEEEDLSRSWWLNPKNMHLPGQTHLAMSPMLPEVWPYSGLRSELVIMYEVPL
jgi:hypothetical protein